MQAGKKDTGFVFKQMLSAIAVVNIKIHDGHTLELVLIQQMLRPNGDVVEQAEAHSSIPFGMMTWRAHRAKGVSDTRQPIRQQGSRSSHHRIDRRQYPSGCEHGDIKTVTVEVSVTVQMNQPPGTGSRNRRMYCESCTDSTCSKRAGCG